MLIAFAPLDVGLQGDAGNLRVLFFRAKGFRANSPGGFKIPLQWLVLRRAWNKLSSRFTAIWKRSTSKVRREACGACVLLT